MHINTPLHTDIDRKEGWGSVGVGGGEEEKAWGEEEEEEGKRRRRGGRGRGGVQRTTQLRGKTCPHVFKSGGQTGPCRRSNSGPVQGPTSDTYLVQSGARLHHTPRGPASAHDLLIVSPFRSTPNTCLSIFPASARRWRQTDRSKHPRPSSMARFVPAHIV